MEGGEIETAQSRRTRALDPVRDLERKSEQGIGLAMENFCLPKTVLEIRETMSLN